MENIYVLDRFTKTFFWNFQNIQAVLCYILIDKQMLEKGVLLKYRSLIKFQEIPQKKLWTGLVNMEESVKEADVMAEQLAR